MRLIYIISIFLTLLISCKANQGPTNDYKNAKVHESDKLGKGYKKLDRQSRKQAKKSMKAAKKAGSKRNGKFFKMKQRY